MFHLLTLRAADAIFSAVGEAFYIVLVFGDDEDGDCYCEGHVRSVPVKEGEEYRERGGGYHGGERHISFDRRGEDEDQCGEDGRGRAYDGHSAAGRGQPLASPETGETGEKVA